MKLQLLMYQTYMFDIENRLRQKMNHTVTNSVQLLEIKKKFFKTYTKVISLESKEIFWCEAKYLSPVPIMASYVVRFPEDSPLIDIKDLRTLKEAGKALADNKELNDKLKLLYEKLSYYTILHHSMEEWKKMYGGDNNGNNIQ